MKQFYTLAIFVLLSSFASAQCDGCIINTACTANPVAPALCPDILTDAVQNEEYNIDVTFFMPQQFDDAGSGFTVTLSQIQITSVSGLPAGLSWTCNELDNIYDITSDPATQRGCVKICGTPTSIGSYTIAVNIIAFVSSPISTQSAQTFTWPLLVVPGGGGNSGFSFEPSSGCDSIAVGFEALISSQTQPVEYTWDFGNGNSSNEMLPDTQVYTIPGEYYVSLQTDLLNYVLESVNFNVTGNNWCGDVEEPNIFGCTGSPDVYLVFTVGSSSQTTGTVDNNTSFSQSNLGFVINEPSFSLNFFDEDVISQPDNLGTAILQITTPGTFSFNTSQGFGTYTIGTQVGLSFTNVDTVRLFDSPGLPLISISDSLVCLPDSITLLASSANAYQWFDSEGQLFGANDSVLIANASGSFRVEVRNEFGCAAISDSVTVTVASVPDPASVFLNPATGQLLCNPGQGLQWYWLLDQVEIPGSDNLATLQPTEIGNYSVIAFNSNGCSIQTEEVFFTNVGINDFYGNQEVKMFPNPVSEGQLTITGINEQLEFELFDLSGRLVFNQSLQAGPRKFIQFPELIEGIYLVRLRGASGISTSKITIAHP
jgi:hypothetical protein